jgi:hypothetical protein
MFVDVLNESSKGSDPRPCVIEDQGRIMFWRQLKRLPVGTRNRQMLAEI